MPNCRQVTELCSQEHDRKLSLRERIAMRMHLMICIGCTRFREQMDFISKSSERYFRMPTEAVQPREGEPRE